MTAEENAEADVIAVNNFRRELAKGRPIIARSTVITDSQKAVARERERVAYASRQHSLMGSLATYEPLYRTRIELLRPDDSFRVYFSPFGGDFEPVPDMETLDVLVSWAHPRFLAMRDSTCGDTIKLRDKTWRIISRTELDREHLGTLYDLLVKGESFSDELFLKVHLEGRRAIVIRVDDKIAPRESVEPAKPIEKVTEAEAKAEEVAPPEPIDEIFPQEDVLEAEVQEKPRFALDTIVKRKDGRTVEIPFALDELQWAAMSRCAAAGTILLTGPPGTGKTTVALLRATTLIHSIYEHDEHGRRLSDQPTVDLRRDRFRVVVVTEHLRTYLKEFLSSPELGLPEAQVVNLRGAFLENFVRHKTLATWINGLRFRLSKPKNRLSDALLYIKSLRSTLRLCVYHALLNAQENAGENFGSVTEAIYGRLYDELERSTLRRVLTDYELKNWQKESENGDGDVEAFLSQCGKLEAFHEKFDPRDLTIRRGLTDLREFLKRWLARATERILEAIDSEKETLLVPGGDELLLSRFVLEIPSVKDKPEWNQFVRETWRTLVHLVDPKDVLLRVINDLANTGDSKDLHDAGLNLRAAQEALSEWKTALNGEGDVGRSDEDEEESAMDDFEEDFDSDEDLGFERRKGAFTRSDFPLLAAMARVFLAAPPEARQEPARYRGVGFSLPDDLLRYDHVIIDEGQDFTYAEIHLVHSLVESSRAAVTISGDPHQRMDWRSGFSSLETIRPDEGRAFHINTNYRQTVQLSDWLSRLNGALFPKTAQKIDAAFESGPLPKIDVMADLKETRQAAAASFSDWYEEDSNPFTAAILIGVEGKQKRSITVSLASLLEDRAIHVETIEDGRVIERGRVSVVDVPTVKGLEFDGVVVIVGKSACSLLDEQSPAGIVTRNKLFVACSRAKRNLHVILGAEVAVLKKGGLYE